MLRANLKWRAVTRFVGVCLVLILAIGTIGCEQSTTTTPSLTSHTATSDALTNTDGPLSEVNIPETITKLAPRLEKFQPQVYILSPQPDQILTDDRVRVKLRVSDLTLFKSPELGLGNHLHLMLDKQPYQAVYDLTQPLVFENLAAGTHTLRVFAARPWHESFKNEGAYAQITFHVFTKTAENNPTAQQPLLTYSRPAGTYGAEPIMLDYYVTDAPTEPVAKESSSRQSDWKIRVTVNNQRFIVDRWEPIYLQGFKQGKNWVRMELIDALGNPISNVYNDTIGIFTYDPHTKDSLAKLIEGDIDPDLAHTLVDPSYIAANPKPTPTPIATTPAKETTPTPPPANSVPPATPIPTPPPLITPLPSPIAIAPQQPSAIPSPESTALPQPVATPASPVIVKTQPPIAIPNPVIIPSPQPIATPSPNPVQIPPATPESEPGGIPTPLESGQPQIAPSPSIVPVIIMPHPIAAAQPTPVATPAPTAPTDPGYAPPQPILMPSPVVSPQPSTPTAPSIPQAARADKAEPPPVTPSPITPTANQPLVAEPTQKTWQAQAIELIKFAGVKIRAFTNTIPGKAQRFGHNVQIWSGKAIEIVRSWRNREAG